MSEVGAASLKERSSYESKEHDERARRVYDEPYSRRSLPRSGLVNQEGASSNKQSNNAKQPKTYLLDVTHIIMRA